MLRYAEKSDLGKWPEVTSSVEYSQCLPIYFNIFNDTKNTVLHDNCSSTYIENMILQRLCFYAYFALTKCSTGDVISLSTWWFVFYGIFVDR